MKKSTQAPCAQFFQCSNKIMDQSDDVNNGSPVGDADSKDFHKSEPRQRQNGKDSVDHSKKNSQYPQTYFADEMIEIPDIPDNYGFSMRKLWAFTGPGFLMSIAYLDPGNIASDLSSGVAAKYKLLWVLMGATILGLLMQRLSARLGVVTGVDLAGMCYRQYKTVPRLFLWIMTEIAIIGSDMQEVIGTAFALYLLTSKSLPLYLGVLITIFDTFTFLYLDRYGLRKLELIFGILITIMGVSFGYEFFTSSPPTLEVLGGLVKPFRDDYDQSAIIKAVEIIGAVIMPHNLYLHSALVKSRAVDRKKPEKVKEANMYFFTESSIALFCSFIINVFVVSVFANGLFGKNESDIYGVCEKSETEWWKGEFQNDTRNVDIGIFKGGIYLGCQFGAVAMYVWAVGILAAGQSSTLTGTYSGQFAMEGFLNLKWARWQRVLFTRSIAMVPTFLVAFYANQDSMTALNDILNAVMTLQLPFATIPTIAFTSSAVIMGTFKNGWFNKIVSIALSALVIGINIYFVLRKIEEKLGDAHWAIYVGFGIYGFIYLSFCVYFVIHMAIFMGATFLLKYEFMKKYFGEPVEVDDGNLMNGESHKMSTHTQNGGE